MHMETLTREECQAIIDQDHEWRDLDVEKWYGAKLKCKTTDFHFWNEKYPDVPILYECINRYEVGDYAEEHVDSAWRMMNPNYVASTVWITPLNDDYEGGELYFDGELMEQEIGVPIKYPRKTPHEIKPVTKGTRYSLVSWVFVRRKDTQKKG